MIDQTAFFSLSYGLYVISSKDADRAAGCVANTFQQDVYKRQTQGHRWKQEEA